MTEPIGEKLLGTIVAMTGLGAIGAALTIGSGMEAWGARTFPILGGGAMVLAGIAVAREPSGAARAASATDGGLRALWLVLLSALYVLALGRIGFLAATALTAPLAFALFGVRAPRTLLLAAILCPLALHLFFFRLLGVFPPYSAWFDLADLLPL
ncbi:MAG: tripartite tricarboxylate transporter TctB family protein [Pseudomonadota bacterium]